MAGSGPAKVIFGCVWIVADNRFLSTGQPCGLARPPTSSRQPIVKVVPIRVILMDQANFPGTRPVLYVRFALFCRKNVCVVLGIDQST